MKPKTTYILSASGKVTTPGNKVRVSAINNGLFLMECTSSQYEQKSVEFTTPNSSKPTYLGIVFPVTNAGVTDAYLDDIVLVEK
ncbi:hypothetical protein U9K47_28470 [Bacillus toyonensis]|uniref:hypothetical protein n=1 Tax=Bacillus toyonensis TaxID=155322 RepID=UPI000A19F5F8|nr:hypothetical protein [Bacillus toyonensis]OSM11041.1 hypothetical protein BTH38_22370 [Bacillus toyonensis]